MVYAVGLYVLYCGRQYAMGWEHITYQPYTMCVSRDNIDRTACSFPPCRLHAHNALHDVGQNLSAPV